MQTKSLYRLASLLVVISLLSSANLAARAASPLAVQALRAASQAGDDWQPTFPIRAAFYYPWFPQAWTQSGIFPYTNYTPSLGYYSSDDLNIVRQHIEMMQYANIQAGISSWWGQGQHTDTKFAGLLSAAAGTNFRWALYYENESQADPSVDQIQGDLVYIRDHYGNDPSFLRVNGKFVIFVYAAVNDTCGMADRWKQANTVGAYVVLKVFPGYASCASQPDDWHQYSPAVAANQQGTISYSISPGFWLKGQDVRLARDINRWGQNVKDMVASGARWQLITTFSEWGEGTAVEPAAEWASDSGYGQYLDALHETSIGSAPVVSASDGTSPDRVNVSWTVSSGATYYVAYRSESLTGVKIPANGLITASLGGDDTWASPGVTYYYWVKACNATGCSGFSAPEIGWRGLTPPVVTASNGTDASKVNVSWAASSGATSYIAYRSDSPTGTKLPTGGFVTTALGGGDTQATPGVTYYYWVKACNGGFCSDFSAYATGSRANSAANVLIQG